MTSLAALIEHELKRRQVTQAQAAKVLNTSQQQVSRWLAGARPGESSWPALAEFLGISEVELSTTCPNRRRRARSRDGARSSSLSGDGTSRPATGLFEEGPASTDELCSATSAPSRREDHLQVAAVTDGEQHDLAAAQREFGRIFLKRWNEEPLPDEVVITMLRYFGLSDR
jgi:transcriptional regulator with XRE-family HTH domain